MRIEEVMKEVGVAKGSASAIWSGDHRRRGVQNAVMKLLRNEGWHVVLVTEDVTDDLLESIEPTEVRRLVAGAGSNQPAVGFYFPDGRTNDPIARWLRIEQAWTSGGSGGNMALSIASDLAAGRITPEEARVSLDILQHRLLNGDVPEHRRVVQREFPAIPKRVGGQYPLGIQKAPGRSK